MRTEELARFDEFASCAYLLFTVDIVLSGLLRCRVTLLLFRRTFLAMLRLSVVCVLVVGELIPGLDLFAPRATLDISRSR